MSFLKDIGKIAKVVVKSPITKVGLGGVALVFPAVGVPALAGVAAAEKLIDAAERGNVAKGLASAAVAGAGGFAGANPSIAASLSAASNALPEAKKAMAIIAATRKQAEAGDPGAQHALKVLKAVKAARDGNPKAQAALSTYVKKNVVHVIAAGKKPDATPAEQSQAGLVSGLLKGTAARKMAARKYGVNRHTARVVRVA